MSGFLKRPNGQSVAAGHGRKGTVAVVALLLAGASLGGCMKTGPRYEAPFMLANPSERHPILVSNAEATLDLDIYRGSTGLTGYQQGQLASFLRGYRREEGNRLLIRAPSGGPNERATMSAFNDVKRILRANGFTSDMVQLEPYYASYKSNAPLRLSYMRYVAKAPDCPDWSENVARDPQNMPYPNLGCATQTNLAAMVAEPRDLIEPRGETPRSGERRDNVWGKYTQGETTGSKWAPEEKPISEHATASDVQGGD
jgi:pilus assembly protein CpaD